ncbi:MAG: CPBP family intramembrane metalloprotease, partial [Clostridia bacterium]|nr:CPBP family intramembrane metalloprotease [Clostridia bacterium]
YDKSKICFAVTWIIAYCVLMSLGDAVSAYIGIEKLVTLIIAFVLFAILLLFFKNNQLFLEFGLCAPKTTPKSMLFYLPIIVMLSANLWYGVTLNYNLLETILYIITMFLVGFLEELIFRGFLFESIRKDNLKTAVIISSVTVGIGHIINLINGSGAELIPNLLQVVYATSAGFMFVMMYLKSKSLIVCITSHGIFNALSAFSNEAYVTNEMQILSALLLTVITSSYALYLALSTRNKQYK